MPEEKPQIGDRVVFSHSDYVVSRVVGWWSGDGVRIGPSGKRFHGGPIVNLTQSHITADIPRPSNSFFRHVCIEKTPGGWRAKQKEKS